MKKNLNIPYLSLLFVLLLISACDKNGEFVVKPTKAFKPLVIGTGYILGDTLDLYIDAELVRSYYGNIGSDYSIEQIAFEADQTTMEFKRKRTGETVYRKTFNLSDATNAIPKLYFDGSKVVSAYTYPAPVGAAYTANFYFDFPKGSPPVDVMLEILEYYQDKSSGKTVNVVLGVTSIPLATNLAIGQWSAYVQLPVVPVLVKNNPQSRFITYASVKKLGGTEYYLDNSNPDILLKLPKNSFKLQFPTASTSQGKVQSFHFAKTGFTTATDLVPIFPK